MKLQTLFEDSNKPTIYVIPQGPVTFDMGQRSETERFAIVAIDYVIPIANKLGSPHRPVYVCNYDLDSAISPHPYQEGTEVRVLELYLPLNQRKPGRIKTWDERDRKLDELGTWKKCNTAKDVIDWLAPGFNQEIMSIAQLFEIYRTLQVDPDNKDINYTKTRTYNKPDAMA